MPPPCLLAPVSSYSTPPESVEPSFCHRDSEVGTVLHGTMQGAVLRPGGCTTCSHRLTLNSTRSCRAGVTSPLWRGEDQICKRPRGCPFAL